MSQPTFRLLAVMGALAVSTSALALGGRPTVDEEAANARIAPVAKVQLAAPSAGAGAGDRSGEQIYKAACAACHDTGAAGAPKTGDKGAWGGRIGMGLDGLTKSAIAGKGAMPPKGGSDANDLELARAIAYMANKSGASFKEPAKK